MRDADFRESDHRAWWHSSSKHRLLKPTTTDEDRRQANEQDKDKHPDDYEKGRVGSTRRSRAGPPSFLSSVSSAAGSPALPHHYASEGLLRREPGLGPYAMHMLATMRTGAMRNSENPGQGKFREFLFPALG
jgi:hypothetical protein